MKNRLNSYVLLVLLLGAYTSISCKKDITPVESASPTYQNTSTQEESYDNSEENTEELSSGEEYNFPKTGSIAEDFIPKGTSFKIEYQTTGDLNSDNLADIAMVLSDPTKHYTYRPLIILLQNANGTYRLDKMSKVVMPSEYTENDYTKRELESLNIENDGLSISFNSTGFHGNIDYFFKYIKNEFVLFEYEGTWHGAGGHTSINYSNKEKKIYKTDYYYDISTDEETTNTSDALINNNTYKFEDINPDKYISLLIKEYLDKESE
ncbi:MAG: hypothetical protein LBI72_04190 [Flavobacteriaceae bacterium]|jgi:hypothetical protein|nr:hypothetical protein [Flavobacteriaceae bacterium]